MKSYPQFVNSKNYQSSTPREQSGINYSDTRSSGGVFFFFPIMLVFFFVLKFNLFWIFVLFMIFAFSGTNNHHGSNSRVSSTFTVNKDKFCTDCRNKLDFDAVFCSECGKKL